MKELTLVVAVIVIGTSAHAQEKDKARDAFRRASQHYELGEYQEALEGFKEAYRNFEDPAFLFNLAQCHRQLGDDEQAVREYRMYLVKMPGAPNQGVVFDLIAKLEGTIAEEKANKTSPPQAMAPLANSAPAAAPSTLSVRGGAPTAKPPLYKRWWLWTTVGGVVIAGVAVGAIVGASRASTSVPKTDLGGFTF